jgi:hypothetical protein
MALTIIGGLFEEIKQPGFAASGAKGAASMIGRNGDIPFRGEVFVRDRGSLRIRRIIEKHGE